jgi:hypothetical protein
LTTSQTILATLVRAPEVAHVSADLVTRTPKVPAGGRMRRDVAGKDAAWSHREGTQVFGLPDLRKHRVKVGAESKRGFVRPLDKTYLSR